jgi:hypothetical protein
VRAPSVEAQIAKFVGEYTPEIAADIQACRRKLHKLFPRGYELVYDSHNALVFGYAASQRGSEAILSIAAYPRWLTLFFLWGATLKDPHSLLEGAGKQVRRITLKSPSDLDGPKVRALIKQALTPSGGALAQAPPLATVIRAVAAKPRPRRPAESASARARPTKQRPTAKSTRKTP